VTDLLPPDLETVAIEWLSTSTELVELLGSADFVAGKLRRGFTKGDRAVRITRTGGTPDPAADGWLDRARLTVEAFAGDDLEAYNIAARALVELRKLGGQKVTGGVVTAVRQDLGLRRIPDPISGAHRYEFAAILFAHPAES
jgi:hypothetical protein